MKLISNSNNLNVEEFIDCAADFEKGYPSGTQIANVLGPVPGSVGEVPAANDRILTEAMVLRYDELKATWKDRFGIWHRVRGPGRSNSGRAKLSGTHN